MNGYPRLGWVDINRFLQCTMSFDETGKLTYVAIITYCLVAIVQHDMRLERSTYEILQILSISLTDETPLKDLFNKTDYHDVKERIDNSELLLFYS